VKNGIEGLVGQEVAAWYNDPKTRGRMLLQRCTLPNIAAAHKEVLVERKELEDLIAAHARKAVSEEYLVVAGPRGSGKTTLVKKMLLGREKVVYVSLKSEVQTIQAVLRGKLGIPSGEPLDLEHCFEAFEGLTGEAKPVLVVELDSNVSADAVRQQSQEMKILCSDQNLAHGILVLSDANAVFKLNPDPKRQRILWVGDLDENEANALLDNFGVLQRGDPDLARLRDRLFREVGANPQNLVLKGSEAKTAKEEAVAAISSSSDPTGAERAKAAKAAERAFYERYIHEEQQDALKEVDNLLTQAESKGDFRRLLLALLKNPAGVKSHEVHFSSLEASEEIKPKGFHAVTYNSEAKSFQFYSKAHEHAARAWFEHEASASLWRKLLRLGSLRTRSPHSSAPRALTSDPPVSET